MTVKMKDKYIIILFIQFAFLNCFSKEYEFESIEPFENKSIVLNETNKFKIYELNNTNDGIIYIYFKEGGHISTRVSIYYNKYNIQLNEEQNNFVNYIEQKNLYQKKIITFTVNKGTIYFVISNFDRDITEEFHLINNLGYYDITKYELFKYFYNFPTVKRNNISFSFDNRKKQKNFLYYQINDFLPEMRDETEIKTNTSNKNLNIDKKSIKNSGIIDISKYKNETINIRFIIHTEYTSYSLNQGFELLIYYSDYKYTFQIMNKESSIIYVPSIIENKYYIYVDINKAYNYIYLTVNNNNQNISGKYHFYDSNFIDEIIEILPDYNSNEGKNISYYKLNDNQIKIKVEKPDNFKKSLLFHIKTSSDAQYKVNFYKYNDINYLQNITFNLWRNFIIYKFSSNLGNYIYT